MGSWSHCCGGPGFGGMLHLLHFQKMLWEKEKAKESEREEDRPSQKGKGRGRRGWRKGKSFPAAQHCIILPSLDVHDEYLLQ